MAGGRAAILVGAGLLATLAAAAVAWRFDHNARTYMTDGGAIREPASSAPLREILWTPPTSTTVNTSDDDYEPRLTADGRTMFFVRGRAGHNADIYTSHRTPDGWSPPEPLAAINTDKDELGPDLSPDERSLYFASNRDGGAGGYDLWVARRDGEAWGEPTNLAAFNTADHEYNPALTPDGLTIYFSSNRSRPGETPADKSASWPATVRENTPSHDFDLYRAPLDAPAPAEPAEPVEPVDALNSPANDGTPAFSPAGDFIYFASDRKGGAGGFDLYRARLHNGQPGRVESLGLPVNTSANELDPTLDMGGFSLHFSSDRPPLEPARIAGAARDYNIFESVSHEVYRVTEPASAARWASMFQQILPWLIWFLISLLTVLLIVLLWRAQRNRHLSLLTRCLIGSLLVHLIILFLLSLWGVTTSLGTLFHKPGGTRVRLASAGTGDTLATQVRGSSPMLPVAITMFPPADAPVGTSTPSNDPVQTETARSAPAPDRLTSQPPLAEATAPSRPPDSRPDPAPVATPDVAPDVAVPSPAPATSTSEAESAVTLATPATPDPRPRASQARPEEVQALPAVAPPPAADLAGSPAPPEATPAASAPPASGATLAAHPENSAQVATPQDASAAAAPEPSAQIGIAHTTTPDPGLAIGPSASSSQISAGAPARSSPSAGGTLAPSNQTTTANPTAALPSAADLASGQPALDIALPSDHPADSGANAATEAQSNPGSLAIEASEPALQISTGGSSARAPAAAPSGISSGPSLAITPPSDLAAPAPSTPARSAGLAPGAPAFDLALPEAGSPTANPIAANEAAGTHGAPLNLGASEPAPSMAAGARQTGGRDVSPSEISPGASLAGADPASSPESPAPPSPTAAAIALTAADPAAEIALPQEVAPPEDQFAQRDPEHRLDIVERLGGSRETEEAVARSLTWLAAHQSPDGRWSSGHFDDHCGQCGGQTKIDSDHAITGLALLCFLASDHTPSKDGPYRDNVNRALRWLVSEQKPSGDLRGDETMYSHGIATIALAEAYGMTRDRTLAEPLKRAVAFIAEARNSQDGGWRYEPGDPGDTSVLGWQAMALTSARRAGIDIPPEPIAAADHWLDSVSTETPGCYGYQPGMPPTHAMTAEGLYVRQILGHARDEAIMQASVARIMRNPPKWDERPSTYAWYYATLALFQNGGPEWSEWNAQLTRELLGHQRTQGTPSGSWDPNDRWAQIGGRVYQTAICTLSLEVYYRYLPMYGVAGGAGPAPNEAPTGATQPSP